VIVSTTVPLNTKAPQPRNAKLLCEVTDLNQQTVSQAAEIAFDQLGFLSRHRQAAGGGAEGRQALHPTSCGAAGRIAESQSGSREAARDAHSTWLTLSVGH